jgi:AcrR family transcriptional regulator
MMAAGVKGLPSQSPRTQSRVQQSPRTRTSRARREGNGFAHVQVAQIQRARILSAMFDVATERGAANVSVADVVERSGVSRRTFYEFFSDREDCFLAAFDDALAAASALVLPAYEAGGGWCKRIRAGLVALLCFLDEEPVIGRLLIVESLSGDARMLERRNRLLAVLAEVIDEGRGESADSTSLPPLTAEGLVGGALAVIHARIARPERTRGTPTREASEGSPLLGLVNQLVSMIVLPYLGPGVARRELERAAEQHASARRDARLVEDPFKGAGMRLTYRTVRVLMAIADHSGASNRVVGESAGIGDQGQISKLLGRIERLGLIVNSGLGPGLGAPNAWSLTEKGRQLANGIRAHTERST